MNFFMNLSTQSFVDDTMATSTNEKTAYQILMHSFQIILKIKKAKLPRYHMHIEEVHIFNHSIVWF